MTPITTLHAILYMLYCSNRSVLHTLMGAHASHQVVSIVTVRRVTMPSWAMPERRRVRSIAQSHQQGSFDPHHGSHQSSQAR